MAKTTTAAETSSFAHLVSAALTLGRGNRASTTDDNENNPGADDDEDKDMESDDPDKDCEDDADADADAEDDDMGGDDDMDDKEKAAFRKGRVAANKRARAIFASPAAAGRPDLAAQLAFDSPKLSAKEAIGILTAAGPAPKGRGSLDDRMGARRDPRPGSDGAASSTGKGGTALSRQMIAIGQKLGQVVKD
ncbi:MULTISPECIES: hypothetical protein [Sphingomonas]|uniref:hypothetical protein n=1 Tax=Sphingomonas TaxID=13687 RepID=UPI00082D8B3C|nr:hypothetical protein [Sphingomonas sp. CCH10-B3]